MLVSIDPIIVADERIATQQMLSIDLQLVPKSYIYNTKDFIIPTPAPRLIFVGTCADMVPHRRHFIVPIIYWARIDLYVAIFRFYLCMVSRMLRNCFFLFFCACVSVF